MPATRRSSCGSRRLDEVLFGHNLTRRMDSAPLSFPGLLAGTLSRWRTVLWVAGGIVALALALTLVLPPSYRATASFVTAESPSDLPSGLSDLAREPGFSGLASKLGFSG